MTCSKRGKKGVFCKFALVCRCPSQRENCSYNCEQFPAKIAARIVLLNLHKCTTSPAPSTPSAEENRVAIKEIGEPKMKKIACHLKNVALQSYKFVILIMEF